MLAPAGVRAALREAIDEARRDGLLVALGPVADTPGVLRRLRTRVAAWTRQGRRTPPSGGGIVAAEEWAVFGRYRAILKAIDAEDPEASALRAARACRREPPAAVRDAGRVVVLDPVGLDRAGWLALEGFRDHAPDLLITLPFDPDPALADAFGAVAPIRDRLLSWGFVETRHAPGPERPAGLLGVERGAICANAPRGRLDRTDGLRIVGAPQGEGEAAVVARRVKELLAAGVEPEAILVLFRRWGESADLTFETMRAWGLPAAAAPPRGLATAPAASALALAMGLPALGWESAGLMTLLRHSQVRPDWPEARAPLALALTAAAVRDARVFRDRDRLRDSIRRASMVGDDETGDDLGLRRRRAARARVALPVLDRLASVFEGLERAAIWEERVEQLRRLAADLRIGQAGGDAFALDHLFAALDDHGDVLAGLGRADLPWDWPDFAAEVRALIRDLDLPAPPPLPGSVRLATVDEGEGARADHVILAGLAEGAFPDRSAIEADEADDSAPQERAGVRASAEVEPTEDAHEPKFTLSADAPEPAPAPAPEDRAYAREMLRFLRVVGSAGATLTLTYPTADEKGQALLAAGFLDDARRLFAPDARPAFAAPIARLDPALMPADLAGTRADARVRAVALAAGHPGHPAELRRLARSPAHREPLMAAAAALRVARSRSLDPEFGPFDGRLVDPAAIRRIADDFAPGRHAFSPSQLESLAFCPFQFFQRYVLRLEPPDDRDELDDDRAARGSLIHRVLELLHSRLRDIPPDSADDTPAGRVAASIAGVIEGILDGEIPASSDVEAGLRAIQSARLRVVGRRYSNQFAKYAEGDGAAAHCRHVEVEFGTGDDADGFPALELGEGPSAVRLRGKIDRIDLLPAAGRTYFRVIDYKSGSSPGKGEVEGGLALQLPLYALAVERVGLAGPDAAPLDVGYWRLGAKGYLPVVKMAKPDGAEAGNWGTDRGRFERFVLDLVAQLRLGVLPVRPRVDGCVRLCEFHVACRIVQVRAAAKVWDDEPKMEGPAR